MGEIAARQHGVVARSQLRDAGVSGAAVARMTASEWLTGELWDMLGPIEGPSHVTVRNGRRTHAGIVLHRTRDPGHHIARHGIPVTTPSRTLIDLAAATSARRLRQAVEAADRHRLLDVTELSRLLEASSGRKGTGRLSSLLAHYRSVPETRSELERRFLRLCRDAGLPTPAVNVPVAGFEVDFLWPEARLVIELDGYAFHRDRASFERDRRRDAILQLADYRVLRVTDRRLVEEAASVVAELRTMLGSPN